MSTSAQPPQDILISHQILKFSFLQKAVLFLVFSFTRLLSLPPPPPHRTRPSFLVFFLSLVHFLLITSEKAMGGNSAKKAAKADAKAKKVTSDTKVVNGASAKSAVLNLSYTCVHALITKTEECCKPEKDTYKEEGTEQ